jgi:hypothetical protein
MSPLHVSVVKPPSSGCTKGLMLRSVFFTSAPLDEEWILWPLVHPEDGGLTTETCRGAIDTNIWL